VADMTAKKGSKPKKAAKAESEVQELMAKAVRRGDKLNRTLTQIVSKTKLDPSHPVHALLKALDKGMSKLRHHGEAQEQSGGSAKTANRKATTEPAPPVSATSDGAAEPPRPARARRTKKPAPVSPAGGEAPPTSALK
jgi:hypothetical protein